MGWARSCWHRFSGESRKTLVCSSLAEIPKQNEVALHIEDAQIIQDICFPLTWKMCMNLSMPNRSSYCIAGREV